MEMIFKILEVFTIISIIVSSIYIMIKTIKKNNKETNEFVNDYLKRLNWQTKVSNKYGGLKYEKFEDFDKAMKNKETFKLGE